jgi:hypothetical protein
MFESGLNRVRWPMYVRNVKQFLRGMESSFDERRFGFGGILDLLRACQRDGIFRLERDRQGVLRVFPGTVLQRPVSEPQPGSATTGEPAMAPEVVAEAELAPVVVEAEVLAETVTAEEPRAEGAPAETLVTGQPVEAPAEEAGAKRRRRRPAAGPRKAAPAAAPRKAKTTRTRVKAKQA